MPLRATAPLPFMTGDLTETAFFSKMVARSVVFLKIGTNGVVNFHLRRAHHSRLRYRPALDIAIARCKIGY